MSSTAVLEKKNLPTSRGRKNGTPAHVATETYYEKYRQREDGWKYELVDGRIEKSEKTTNLSQHFISNNLHDCFFSLKMSGKADGSFTAELDNELWKDHVRIPDLCYLNQQQVVQAFKGGHPVAEFVIEIVSPSDKSEKYKEKIRDYFKAGVKVIWMIYPKVKQVDIYVKDSPHFTTCEGDMICSAAPVLPGFAISVNDIFREPEL